MRRIAVAGILLTAAFALAAQRGGAGRGQGARRGGNPGGIFHTEVPAHVFDLILSRPKADSVTASILAYEELQGYLEYGARQSPQVSLPKGAPVSIVMDGLQPNTRYTYRLRYRKPGSAAFESSEEYSFHTQRKAGSGFVFAVQADSHLDGNSDPEQYKRTLANIRSGAVDFLIDLGDTFMTDQRRSGFRDAFPQYLAQRYYFGLLCHSTPLFLLLGNHDGEGGSRHNGTANSMAAWSNELRKRYFPNPRPDGFYTGNGTRDPAAGLLENYYAWEWGGALFVVLDPYWPTTGRDREDNWNWTLGAEQYRWMKETLEESRAGLRFVFIHHPVGGKGQPIRGGVEAARYNEWGGRNADGSEGFREHRPGWDMPIHQLLAKNRVSVIFHGHDHMFAKEELDGVVYQLVPQPGHARAGGPRNAQEYGYTHGDVLGGSGHLRVKVAKGEATIDYVISVSPRDETGGRKNGTVAYSYSLNPN